MTEKDLLYLTDSFNWNLIALKKFKVYKEYSNENDTNKLIQKLIKLHEDNCNEILSILKENNYEW